MLLTVSVAMPLSRSVVTRTSPPSLVVVNGVGEEVGDDLCEAFGVAVANGGGEIGVDVDTACGGERADEFDAVGGEHGKVAFIAAQRFLAGVEAGQFEERFDEPAHALRGALAGLEGFAVFLVRAFAGEPVLRVGEHHRDGRAQFVRGVGGEAGLLGEGGVEAGEGGVQHAGEVAKFAFGVGGVDALGEVARGNFRGGGADVAMGRRARVTSHAPPASPSRSTRPPAPASSQAKRRIPASSSRMSRPTRKHSPGGVK